MRQSLKKSNQNESCFEEISVQFYGIFREKFFFLFHDKSILTTTKKFLISDDDSHCFHNGKNKLFFPFIQTQIDFHFTQKNKNRNQHKKQ